MRIAVWSPLPPARTGVADYAADQARSLLALAEAGLEIVLVSDAPADAADLAARTATPSSVPPRDVDLYHLGNSPAHGFVLRAALERPGVAMLHENNLHELWLSETVERGDTAAYMREMRAAYGSEGLFAADQIARSLAGAPFRARYPLVERVVASSLAVVASTEATLGSRAVRGALGFRPSLALPHPFWFPPIPEDRVAARERFGVPGDAFLVVAPGLATAEKRIDVLVRAVAATAAELNARLLVAGECPDETAWRDLARSLEVADRVAFTGRLSLDDLARSLVAADAVSALRHSDRGEMSGVAIRAMGIGRAVLVSAGSTLSREFGPDAVLHVLPSIAPGDGLEERELAAALRTLALDGARRRSIEEAARSLVAAAHDPSRAARSLVAFLEGIVRDRESLVARVEADRAAESGLSGYLLQELRGLRDLGGAPLLATARSIALGLGAPRQRIP